ncbi:MAG: SDR family oxidoreductase [bacterium]|nr:SDR family oxidoreductase [bacterium]MCS7309935.1 SDR family oxidoreductase [Armatimonadota bacterium]
MPRAVVTGGAGFLGSHLVDRLLAEGYEVIALDNLITGSIENIVHLAGNERFRFIKQDVTEYLYIDGPVDIIFHFASPASPVDFATKPIQILKVNALGTHKTLGLARAKGARYVLASTSEVYGDPLVHPQPEDYVGNVNPVGMRGAYDEGKRFAEAMTMAYHRHHGLDTRIVRIFNTYGERMRPDDGRMIPTFIGQALRGEPITVYGDGTQTRSFCYVSDMIEGIWRLSQLPGYHEPVNIGNPDERTVLEVAQLVKQLTGSASPVVFCPFFSPDEPRRRQPDITRARQLLGWEPQVSLEEGLRRTIEHFRARLAQR